MMPVEISTVVAFVAFVLCGVGPLLFQVLAIFGARSRAIGALVAKLEPALSTLQFHANWGMFTNQRAGIGSAHKWGYCLRRDGVIVEEKDLPASVTLLKFLERQAFDDPRVAESLAIYLVDHVIDSEHEFDEFELVVHVKPRPPSPQRLFDRFAHDDFTRASFDKRYVALSCQLDV